MSSMAQLFILHSDWFSSCFYIFFSLITHSCELEYKLPICIYCLQENKYNDEDPNALDLFKEFHYSKKTKGYTPCGAVCYC